MSIFQGAAYHGRDNLSLSDSAWNGATKMVFVGGTKLSQLDLTTRMRGADITLPNSGSAVAFIASDQVIVSSNNVNTPYHVNLTTSVVTTLGAADFIRHALKFQQAAGNQTTGQYMAAGLTTGRLIRVDNSGPTASSINPANLTGRQIGTVIRKPGTNLWIVGTRNGRIVEIDFAGTSSNIIDLPTTPVTTGTAPTHDITSLALEGNELLVGTSNGTLWHVNYTTGLVKNAHLVARSLSAPSGIFLSNVANGLVAMMTNESSVNQVITMWDIGSLPITQVDHAFWNGALGQPLGLQLDSVGGVLYIHTGNDIRGINLKGHNSTNIATRAQFPAGTDIAHRLVRLQRAGFGRLKVELDANQPIGEVQVAARLNEQEYIDLSLIGTSFVDEKIDIRRAEA